ncbi:MAG: ABC transporter substrate-binding protein [Zetaproteobacteria bacterium]|nr:ABC transporter substrate-binding protein [Zetaproteobacteria bacterium]
MTQMKKSLWLLSFALFSFILQNSALAQRNDSQEQVHVRVQLKWFHQYQFAGFYAAIKEGYFHDAGLTVELIQGGPTINPSEVVTHGDAEFGIGNSTLLIDHYHGMPVVAVAPLFQHSPFVIIARTDTGIQTIEDLEDKVLMAEEHSAELNAYLHKANVNLDKIHIVPHTGTIESLKRQGNSAVDAASAYLSSEPYDARAANIAYQIFNPRNIDINFYGDTLFTNATFADAHPETVIAMRDALIKGWQYATTHHQEIIEYIATQYMPMVSQKQMFFEAQIIDDLIAADFIEIGYMSYKRWQHIADTFAQASMLPEHYDITPMIFSNERGLPTWIKQTLIILALLCLIVFAVASRFYKLNRSYLSEIVERKRLEEKLLESTRQQIEHEQHRRLESLGLMAGGIAHDFNNLLVPIIGNTEILISKCSDEKAKASLLQILNASNHAALLSKKMLSYSGADHGTNILLRIDDFVHGMRPLIVASVDARINITWDIHHHTLPEVFVDASRLEDMILNIIINGAEAMEKQPDKRLFISIISQDLDQDAIEHGLCSEQAEPGTFVSIIVQDFGSGMSKNILDKLFDPFFSTKFAGRGLGMSTVQAFVQQHHGIVHINTTDDNSQHGTTVMVSLPAVITLAESENDLLIDQNNTRHHQNDPQPSLNDKPVQTALKSIQGRCVLLVDDDEMVRLVTETLLNNRGCTTLSAVNGEDAIDVYKQHSNQIDLVILDMMMPIMNGAQCLIKLKEINPRVKIIVSSGFAENEVYESFDKQQVSALLPKPFQSADLVKVLEQALNQ